MDNAHAACSHRLASAEDRLKDEVEAKLEVFSGWGVRVVAEACAAAHEAFAAADTALRGLEADHYERCVTAVGQSVDRAVAVVAQEEQRVACLQRIKDAETLVFLIRNKGADSGGSGNGVGNVLESSAPLRGAVEAAEARLVAFRDARRQASVSGAAGAGGGGLNGGLGGAGPGSPLGLGGGVGGAAKSSRAMRINDGVRTRYKAASELADGALLMDLPTLAAAAEDLATAAEHCQALFDRETELAKSERHKRLALIRDNFEHGGSRR